MGFPLTLVNLVALCLTHFAAHCVSVQGRLSRLSHEVMLNFTVIALHHRLMTLLHCLVALPRCLPLHCCFASHNLTQPYNCPTLPHIALH